MKKLIVFILFILITFVSKSQTLFEFDYIETKFDGINTKKEIYGKIIIDGDTLKMTTEYNGLIFNDKISEFIYVANPKINVQEYCYILNENELLHIFKYNDKIYSIVISSTVNHKNYTIYSKKYI